MSDGTGTAGRRQRVTGWLVVLASSVPGMAPRAPRRNVLVLLGYVLVVAVGASALASTVASPP